jgi:hypothetical protein
MQVQLAAERRAADARAIALQEQVAADRLAMQEQLAADRQVLVTQFQRQHDTDVEHARQESDRRIQDAQRYDNRLARATKITKNLLYNMPNDAAQVCSYLSNLDTVLNENHIDADLRCTLLQPFLNPRIRNLMCNISAEERNDYDKFKTRILREYSLTPSAHKANFDQVRRTNETATQFVNRIGVLLAAYLQAKKVTTFPQLINLLVLDKFKSSLSTTLKHMLADKELVETDVC